MFGVSAQVGSVVGKVIDEPTGHPLEYTTATLKSKVDSSLVTGCVADSNGSISLNSVPYGEYFLSLNFMGYKPMVIDSVELSNESPMVNLSAIYLKSDNSLEQVEIVTDKAVFENRIDKKVFNASESDVGKGGNGLDLMRNVPLVTVDQNDNILLRGDANVTIFIDGRPSAIPVSDLLKQIPGTSIDRIELITNPSAKYDPEGMSGIINVILKKEKMQGMNGSLSVSGGYSKFYKSNNSLTLNYRKDKLNISSRIGYSKRKIWFGGSLQRNVLLGDTLWDILEQEDYGERINGGLSGRIGVDYFLNDKNTLYLSASTNRGSNDGSRLVEYNNVDGDENLLSYSAREGNINAPNTSYDFNGGWQKTFNKPDHTLDIDLSVSTFDMLADERLRQDFYGGNNDFYLTQFQNTLAASKFNTYLGKVDYTLPITDSIQLESGFHYTHRYSDNDFFSESGLVDSELTEDTLISNNFTYLQATYAPYITLSKQFKKLGVKAGLRAEQTETSAEMVTTSESFSNDYFMLFPSVHLNYKLKNNSELQLSYSKRINRPQRGQLNPFTNYSDPLVLERGNPFLLPEVIHVNELSYLKYWKKLTLNASAYYRLITNLIRRNLSYEGTQSLVTYANLGKSSLAGGDLILTYKPLPGVRIMSTTNVWNTATEDTAFANGSKLNLTGVNSSLMASAQLKKGWSMQLWSSFSPRQKVLQGEIIANYGGGFAIAKSMLKNKGRLTVSFVDVFKTRRFGFEGTETDEYAFNSYRNWESRSVYVNFNYSFGKIVPSKSKRAGKNMDSSDDKEIPDMQ